MEERGEVFFPKKSKNVSQPKNSALLFLFIFYGKPNGRMKYVQMTLWTNH
jgi:hypothetical protein